jgi:hypothetical protein
MPHKKPQAAQPRVQLDPGLFRVMLEQMDVEAMACHSSINHHVNGMNYLCLSRSEALTVKLYLMEEPRNDNSGFLVNPHSHRYAFSSIVLAGALAHLRFMPSYATDARAWGRYEYHAETRERTKLCAASLHREVESCPVGTCYFVEPHEIHTLHVDPASPLLLGLVQFADEGTTSDLYLPMADNGEMAMPQTRRPTVAELSALRGRALGLMGGDFDQRTEHFAKVAQGVERLQRDMAGADKQVKGLLQTAVACGGAQ